jgi:signal transduction histidine kinase
MGLSHERPLHSTHGRVPYIRMLDAAEAQTLQSDWEKGKTVYFVLFISLQVHAANTAQVYIHFTVEDTGRGLSEAEQELLFARFSQASPRTHIHYGTLIALSKTELPLTHE